MIACYMYICLRYHRSYTHNFLQVNSVKVPLDVVFFTWTVCIIDDKKKT